jgi:ComF family protein
MLRILDLLFPLRCVGCARELPEGALCEVCQALLPALPAPQCPHCDLRMPGGVLQPNCRRILGLDRFATLGRYTHPMLKAAIDTLKYEGLRDLAAPLGNELAAALQVQWGNTLPKHATLIPVPLHPSRERERGFNQSELLAAQVADQFTWTVDGGALQRTRVTGRQVGLPRAERRENVAGAFRTQWLPPADHVAILIDDVATTGSTLHECARALRAAGARRVWAATLALG